MAIERHLFHAIEGKTDVYIIESIYKTFFRERLISPFGPYERESHAY